MDLTLIVNNNIIINSRISMNQILNTIELRKKLKITTA